MTCVCPERKWTGKLSGNNTCTDGTPGGYGVYLWNGKLAEWYYKSSGFDKKYQFRAYDLNTTYIAPEVYAPKYQEDMKIYAQGYDVKKSNNEILLNIWNYQPDWKIEVTEEGKPLEVTRMEGYDPLHIISYDAKRINAGGKAKVTQLLLMMFMFINPLLSMLVKHTQLQLVNKKEEIYNGYNYE